MRQSKNSIDWKAAQISINDTYKDKVQRSCKRFRRNNKVDGASDGTLTALDTVNNVLKDMIDNGFPTGVIGWLHLLNLPTDG